MVPTVFIPIELFNFEANVRARSVLFLRCFSGSKSKRPQGMQNHTKLKKGENNKINNNIQTDTGSVKGRFPQFSTAAI